MQLEIQNEVGPGGNSNTTPARGRRRRLSPAKRALFVSVLLLVSLVALELGARLVWTIKGLNFWTAPRHIELLYYPDLARQRPDMRRAGQVPPGELDVLIIGGSVVHPALGPIPTMLLERLTVDLDTKVNLFNVAYAAHTSRDSLFKYIDMAGTRFDLIVLYQGINELRANSCPPGTFRDDYSHWGAYRELNAVMAGRDGRIFALPISLRLGAIKLADAIGFGPTLAGDRPPPAPWRQYGAQIKTAGPFRDNLGQLLELAEQRGQKVVLMTYAYHIPPDYTQAAFEARRLDYVVHWFPIEIWGEPDNVAKGLDAHNGIIRELAAAHPDTTLFVDQAREIPDEGRLFNDVCHLSTEGCALFVDNLCDVVEPWAAAHLAKRDAQQP